MISDEDYVSNRIFNVDETGLFWKRMPERNYIQSMSSSKVFKNRLTLLFGGIKQMEVYG